MTERPILFNGEMVRAILDGRKTQTRRMVKPQPRFITHTYPGVAPYWRWEPCKNFSGTFTPSFAREFSPYGEPGDRLWVRETWRGWFPTDDEGQPVGAESWHIRYRADGAERVCDDTTWDEGDFYTSPHDVGLDVEPIKWRPSIHMPRWTSRISLEVTDVRVERVQDMSEEDAFSEGVSGGDWLGDPVGEFLKLWNSINAKRGYCWNSNPWVWAVTFEVIK